MRCLEGEDDLEDDRSVCEVAPMKFKRRNDQSEVASASRLKIRVFHCINSTVATIKMRMRLFVVFLISVINNSEL